MTTDPSTLGQRLLSYVAGPTLSNINQTSTDIRSLLSAISSASSHAALDSATKDLRALLATISASTTSANASVATTSREIIAALDAAQHSLHSADEAATQVRDTLNNPGGGLSGQPTIPRGKFTQKLADFYYNAFNGTEGLASGEKGKRERHHVLVVYDRSPRLVSFREVLGGNGRYVQGPTEMWTVHKKCHRGKGRIGLWGFHVWVFKGAGEFELLGDGGFINWCFKSPDFKRDGKKVTFRKLS